MYTCINNNKLMGTLFLDVAKAFNCINHKILFRKMRNVGMCARVIQWFESYLLQSQMTKYGDNVSNVLEIPAGIAQGTVLGPLIFIFYINDGEKVLENVRISMFADDCVLYYMGNNWNSIRISLQKDLAKCVDWTDMNSLKLNEIKTQAMIVGTGNKFI